MNRGERLEAIQRVAKTLGTRSYREIDLILTTFELPTTDFGSWSDESEYALDMVAKGTDAAVADLDAYLGGDAMASEDEDRIWTSGSFRLFISHTSVNKVRAAAIAKAAARIGISGFVAHDTIEPSREWQRVIETALYTCDALVAMVTSDFVDSRWCDQEVGFVLAQRKPVLALKMGADPHGFMGRYQAIPSSIESDISYDDVQGVVRALIGHRTAGSKIAPVVVQRYARSTSFDSARDAYEMVKAIAPHDWTPAMIETVDRAHAENSQVANANIVSGEPIVDAVNAILEPLRPAEPAVFNGDDDIPF